ncbi:hypothetical protein ENUP19_0368G0011 [Entamoeba nuttalli]|uniref:DUF4832 domain-containing protein n=2 Tax=Entamoeba nuttalli TaxID=412467 RepID=K2GVF6_ENTNP|nr:hypothetical protein ENU1_185700 [Entamoeba nuttalli P19]EKE37812.1 hypothetical protein ENU1_185700 [Entamoeba nuttalli P19]|eukprot:XP_008859856.1 hypothetical protein ENU1_185700 [Entamoeba nuttalli P19]
MKKGVIIGISLFISVIVFCCLLALVIGLAVGLSKNKDNNETIINFSKTEGFLGNPLKGFGMWYGSGNTAKLPLSIQYVRLELNKVLVGENTVNLDYLDSILERIKEMKTQAVIRLVLDSPSESSFVPTYIQNKIEMYDYNGASGAGKSPNYNDEYLLTQLEYLFKELGKKFDGDPRIGFWQLGTYGHWGEWHTTYITDTSKKPTDETLDRIMDMALNNFRVTMCEVRVPETRSQTRGIGFYHDMFGNSDHDVYMDSLINRYNVTDRWKTFSFGGEEDPTQQSTRFESDTKTQKFLNDTVHYHASWVLSNWFFGRTQDWIQTHSEWVERRNKAERLLGYNYYATEGSIIKNSNSIEIKITITNDGVAPFYYHWKIHYGLIDPITFEVQREEESTNDIYGILPLTNKSFSYTLNKIDESQSNLTVALRIPSGVNSHLLLSNTQQREDGWLLFN